MRTISLLLASSVALTAIWLHSCKTSKKAFDQQKWNKSREQNPTLNLAPQMLDDLLAHHLSLGMSLSATTNLIGPPETKVKVGKANWISGGRYDEVIYVYAPGVHKAWNIEGSNALTLRFSADGMNLQEWSPWVHTVRRDAAAPKQTGAAYPDGRLLLGNPQVASTTNQIEELLGPPD